MFTLRSVLVWIRPTRVIRVEIARWAKVIKDAGIPQQ
jgi:hypothetical protein